MKNYELKEWQMEYGGQRYNCQAPASMYGVLLKEGVIDDPYYRDNEQRLTAWSDNDCTFETVLKADDALLCYKHIYLRFEGIDTIADIILNGKKIASVENMHRTFEFDVKGLLVKGDNNVSVRIHSPLSYMREWQKKHPIPGNRESIDGVAQIRKASYMMGWDWGPELPDMGLWRPVRVIAYNESRLTTPTVRQIHKDGAVRLVCRADAEGNTSQDKVRVTLYAPDGSVVESVDTTPEDEVELFISDPMLWWPNGYGEQPLYRLNFVLETAGEITDEKDLTVGLRTLTVSTAKDCWGNEFCFVVNGEKIFSMGANYIPEDNILSRCSAERTERLIQQCVEANFNTIRVWGGGIYAEDYFYELCDRYGIIIWQDMMIACNCVWLTASREENFVEEFKDNIIRIRHHACIGLFNGNNEIELAMARPSNPRNTPLLVADYLRLYHNLLPELCATLAPDTFYWPSSPSSGQSFDGFPSDENRGDCHYWNVWFDYLPYEEYRKKYFRFCSEFGFESLPEPKTVEAFTKPCDRNLFSPIMLKHQKHRGGNGKMMAYLSDYYLYPNDFMGVVYGSQLVQADAIRTAVEHFRRHRGRCMGSLYWQLNDCWPTASWSSVDGCGRWKALHYAAKRFYAPVLLAAHENGMTVTFNISNETRNEFCGDVILKLKNQAFDVLWENSFSVSLDALQSQDVRTVDFAKMIDGRERDAFLEYTLTDADGKIISRSVHLFVNPKYYRYKKPQIKQSITPTENGLCLHLSSDTFAHRVRLDFGTYEPKMSDQYVNLTCAEGMDIYLEGVTESDAARLTEQFTTFTVYDIAPECYEC